MFRRAYAPLVKALPAMVVAGAAVLACNDELVEEVTPDVCFSGKRWIGGSRGSAEMYPGRDCVGCHADNDGPELMFGGTFYAGSDVEGIQAQDCFGLAGVTVTVTGADGKSFSSVTNAAGNFFAYGRQSDLVTPYQVQAVNPAYDPPEVVSMGLGGVGTRPSYGGCARCHTLGVEPVGDPADFLPPRDGVKNAGGEVGRYQSFREQLVNMGITPATPRQQ
jgi:hypothetical protein